MPTPEEVLPFSFYIIGFVAPILALWLGWEFGLTALKRFFSMFGSKD